MRVLTAVAAAALVLACTAGFGTAAGSATTGVTATVRVTVRPVTSTGHVRTGYTITHEPTGGVDCSVPVPSSGAVNENIDFCGPSTEYAVACWKAAAATPHVYCLRNPRVHTVVKIPRIGPFAQTAAPGPAQLAPLAIDLRDGDHCSIRDGGVTGTLQSHPQWVATYFCLNDGAIWAPLTANHQGVNESNPSWTVRTAPASGVGAIVVRHVTKAWFVGTFSFG